MKNVFRFAGLFFFVFRLTAQTNSFSTSIKAIDIDGFEYKTAKLGTQTWMAQNLNVTRFRNGDPIMEAKTKEEWEKADLEGIPAWCYYNNDFENGPKHGKLYNWHAVTDPRGLAPAKWHVPNLEEWNRLINFLGGNMKAGKLLKDSTGWHNGGNGTNKSGFSASPSGNRTDMGNFKGLNTFGYWWSRQESNASAAWGCDMGHAYPQINVYAFRKGNGFAVRCVRD
jgi:uncharacterized protein (TIGR02145 family)